MQRSSRFFSCAMLSQASQGNGFEIQIAIWLWFTVLFANFAEAMAEARGKAQADALRKTKTDSVAKRLLAGGKIETVPGVEAASGRHGARGDGRSDSR